MKGKFRSPFEADVFVQDSPGTVSYSTTLKLALALLYSTVDYSTRVGRDRRSFYGVQPSDHASFGQNRPPRLDHSSHGIKTRHSFKKGSGSNELNTAIKLQIYIGI